MKVAIAIPSIDTIKGQAFGYHLAAVSEAVKSEHKIVSITPTGICPHDAARQVCLEAAEANDCDLLWFIDADTMSPRGAFARLMDVMAVEKAQIVSGHYIRRGSPYTPVWSSELEKDQRFQCDASGGVHQIQMTGLGCALIDLRWCRANLPARGWFKMIQDDNKTLITDDTTFFRLVKEAGGKVLGDACVRCIHLGRPEFIVSETADGLRKVSDIIESLGIPPFSKESSQTELSEEHVS